MVKERNQKKSKENILSLIKSKYIRSFFKKYWLDYVIGLIFLVFIDYAQTIIPDIIGDVIDSLVNVAEIDLVSELIKIGALAAGIVVGRVAWRYFIFGTARKIERDIRNDIFAHLETLDLTFFYHNKTGDIMAYITNDLEAVRQAMGQGIMMIFDCLCLLVFILTQMFLNISIWLTLVTVIPLGVIAIVSLLLGPRLFRKFFARQQAFAKISDFVQEDVAGIKVIKAFVQQTEEIKAFDKVNKEYFDTNISLAKTRAILNPLMTLISGLSFALAIGFGGYLALNGSISTGDFTVFVTYLGMLVWPMMAVGMSINIVAMGSASLKRIEHILGEKATIVDAPDAVTPEVFEGSIEVKNLTYRYPDTEIDILKNVSFTLEKGQTLGVVGRTGSGKTTLINLLVRLFNVPEGTVFVSGVDIQKMPLKVLRSNIGYVPQDNFLFSDTIRNNVDYVDGNLPMEKVVEATEFSCVHDNIIEFAEGYDTIIGERGVTLSGGQKQRVSISRARIIEPEILVLDDSVSAVDTDTEEKILHNFKRERAGKTNIIIAHRLSALQTADKIIVIDNGEIIEEGDHASLLANNGLYASLYNKQQLEKMINEAD